MSETLKQISPEDSEIGRSQIITRMGDIYAGMRYLTEKGARPITFLEYVSLALDPKTAELFFQKIFPNACAAYNIPAGEILLLDNRYNPYFGNLEAAEQTQTTGRPLHFADWNSVRKQAHANPDEALESGVLLLTEGSYPTKVYRFDLNKIHGNPVLKFLFQDTHALEKLLLGSKKDMDIMLGTPSHMQKYLSITAGYGDPFVNPISCSPPSGSGDSGFNLKSYDNIPFGLVAGIK